MIARHESHVDTADIWTRLAAPLPSTAISWRQDGRPVERDGRYIARFVAYVEANTVRERLDGVVPGEWDLTLELLPAVPGTPPVLDGEEMSVTFKARLQILGVIREDVGTGRDYKSAATDAFKRAAVRFGIAHELYGFEQNWVQLDGEGKNARPLEDPALVYARRQAQAPRRDGSPVDVEVSRALAVESDGSAVGPRAIDEPMCPRCGGRMWDNRLSKRNKRAPDYKCRDRSCDGVIWPSRTAIGELGRTRDGEASSTTPAGGDRSSGAPLGDAEAIPF